MPTAFAEPSVQELLDAFEDGIRSSKDRYVDAREGAIYQHWGGVAAILWSREARRDTDLWRSNYLDSAEGSQLTALLNDRYDFERVTDTYGVGTARLTRPTAAAGSGSVWQGTRIAVLGGTSLPRFYVVSAKREVGAAETIIDVDIRADRPGAGVASSVIPPTGGLTLRLEDPLWDTTWTVERLECADGTSFEPAPAARARLRESRRDARAGFVEAIVRACKDAGAGTALLFPSDYAGDAEDMGLNVAYVGDAGFQGDQALVRRVIIALESWRVLGDNLQVFPLAVSNLVIRANVRLWESPTRVNQDELKRLLRGAALGYFEGSTSGFNYQREALAGAMMRSLPAIQTIDFEEPTSDAGVMQTIGGRLNFPSTLSRYRVRAEDITLSLLPAA